MPLASPRALAIPGRRFLEGKRFRSAPFSSQNEFITGVTKDSTGVVLGSCTVDLFITATDTRILTTTSDASGNFSFENPASGPFYIVAYKAGAPDVAGTSVNTLAATFA